MLPDGHVLKGPDDLRNALLAKPDQFVQTLVEKLMVYATGRTLEYTDMPEVRSIVRDTAPDHYRFESLVMKIVTSPEFQMARTPGRANPEYGYCNWFLNPGRRSMPSAPESSVTFRGNGQNIIYIDWDHDIVAVVRWIGTAAQMDEFVRRTLAAVAR